MEYVALLPESELTQANQQGILDQCSEDFLTYLAQRRKRVNLLMKSFFVPNPQGHK